jgi:hypothetical protein
MSIECCRRYYMSGIEAASTASHHSLLPKQFCPIGDFVYTSPVTHDDMITIQRILIRDRRGTNTSLTTTYSCYITVRLLIYINSPIHPPTIKHTHHLYLRNAHFLYFCAYFVEETHSATAFGESYIMNTTDFCNQVKASWLLHVT